MVRIGWVLSAVFVLIAPVAAAAQSDPQPGVFVCPQHGRMSCGGQGSDACARAAAPRSSQPGDSLVS